MHDVILDLGSFLVITRCIRKLIVCSPYPSTLQGRGTIPTSIVHGRQSYLTRASEWWSLKGYQPVVVLRLKCKARVWAPSGEAVKTTVM